MANDIANTSGAFTGNITQGDSKVKTEGKYNVSSKSTGYDENTDISSITRKNDTNHIHKHYGNAILSVLGLQAWWDATKLTINKSAAVTEWKDLTNTQWQLGSVSTGTKYPIFDRHTLTRPSVDTNFQSGWPVGKGLEVNNTDALRFGANESFMTAFVFSTTDVSNASALMTCTADANGAGNGGSHGWDIIYDSSSSVLFRSRNSSGALRYTTSATGQLSGQNNNTLVLVAVRELDSNKCHIWINGEGYSYGTMSSSEDFSTSDVDSQSSLNIGSLADGGSASWTFPGYIAECAIWVRTDDFTNKEVNNVGAFLGRKWRASSAWTEVTQLVN